MGPRQVPPGHCGARLGRSPAPGVSGNGGANRRGAARRLGVPGGRGPVALEGVRAVPPGVCPQVRRGRPGLTDGPRMCGGGGRDGPGRGRGGEAGDGAAGRQGHAGGVAERGRPPARDSSGAGEAAGGRNVRGMGVPEGASPAQRRGPGGSRGARRTRPTASTRCSDEPTSRSRPRTERQREGRRRRTRWRCALPMRRKRGQGRSRDGPEARSGWGPSAPNARALLPQARSAARRLRRLSSARQIRALLGMPTSPAPRRPCHSHALKHTIALLKNLNLQRKNLAWKVACTFGECGFTRETSLCTRRSAPRREALLRGACLTWPRGWGPRTGRRRARRSARSWA